jgi:hypothetical protein
VRFDDTCTAEADFCCAGVAVAAFGSIGDMLERADPLGADRLLTDIGWLIAIGVRTTGCACAAMAVLSPAKSRAALTVCCAPASVRKADDGTTLCWKCQPAESSKRKGDESAAAGSSGKHFGQGIESMDVH